MNKVMTLIRKEILDILRDRKTLIVMVAVPILLYPAMIIGMVLITNMIASSQQETIHTAAYSAEYEEYAEILREIYDENEEDFNLKLKLIPLKEADKETEADNYDAWISFAEDENGLNISVEYTSTNQDSGYTEGILEDLARLYKDKVLEEKLGDYGLTQEFLSPVTYEAKDSVSESESIGMSLGGSIGMMLIVTIMLGAFYPAMDVTTGEKERGTLETLLTLPVTNFQMIMSKYIAVALFACVTAVLSLVSLGASILFLVNSVTDEMSGEFAGITPSMMLGWMPVLLMAMIVTALFITAFCMCFCIFAKSFKEANNYITPVMFFVMFASMVGMLPSAELNYKTALVPIVNVSLLIKQVMAQQMNLALVGITIATNFCYSVLIVWILSKIYDSENVLFADGFQSFKVFEKRSDIKPGTVPKTGDLILSIVVLLLLSIYLGLAVGTESVFASTVVSQFLILGMPLLLVWYMKSDVKTLFSLKLPKVKDFAGGFVLYIGIYALMLVVSFVMMSIFPQSAQNTAMTFDALMEQPFVLVLLVMTIMPAIGEELYFRGLIFGSLRHRYSAVWAIVISSVIFGMFHLSLVKIIPTGMLGACFAYVAYSSGSIYIGMFLHFFNNLLSAISMKYPEQMEKMLPVLMREELLVSDILILLAVGIVCTVAGVWILKGKKKDAVN